MREKALIEQCHEFGITCTYDEILRLKFKSSAAHAASKEKQLHGLLDHKVGIIQVMADNFDANISSPNWLNSTHALALLWTQMQANKPDDMNKETARPTTIRRLNKNDMKEEIVHQVQVSHYNGPKKPDMPERFATHAVLPLKILASQCITLSRARQLDHDFLQRITYDLTTPEYNGFNTQMSRVFGQSVLLQREVSVLHSNNGKLHRR